ncbi:MAG: biopolymer transporter ExbD [Proteobacteria bacterium]|nr:biopolymer transporter ExbD [Pseudomonadota bacterium]MCH8321487.1 biopolymer transporter ExbD [Pseudomonadota bacterium]
MREHSQKEEELEINLTPMLDIVFIMLIFFIVTAVFVKEAGVEVDKPTAAAATKQDLVSILVAITASNEVWINRKQVEIKAVRSIIEKLRSENPKGTVSVQADRKAKAGITLEVMEAARLAGAPNVSISALEDK